MKKNILLFTIPSITLPLSISVSCNKNTNSVENQGEKINESDTNKKIQKNNQQLQDLFVNIKKNVYEKINLVSDEKYKNSLLSKPFTNIIENIFSINSKVFWYLVKIYELDNKQINKMFEFYKLSLEENIKNLNFNDLDPMKHNFIPDFLDIFEILNENIYGKNIKDLFLNKIRDIKNIKNIFSEEQIVDDKLSLLFINTQHFLSNNRDYEEKVLPLMIDMKKNKLEISSILKKIISSELNNYVKNSKNRDILIEYTTDWIYENIHQYNQIFNNEYHENFTKNIDEFLQLLK